MARPMSQLDPGQMPTQACVLRSPVALGVSKSWGHVKMTGLGQTRGRVVYTFPG